MRRLVYRSAALRDLAGIAAHIERKSGSRRAAEAFIGKQRHGPTGTVTLAFVAEATRFTNLADEDKLPARGESGLRSIRMGACLIRRLARDFSHMMILRSSTRSPYARKLRIAADLLGLTSQIAIAGVDLADPNDSIRTQNPLGKIPALALEDGSALYDSRVIAEYLDHLAGGGRLFPTEPARRFTALRLQALGDGVCDAALLLRYENFSRPEALRHPETVALHQGKIDRALAQLEAAPPGGPIDIGHIALACALGYLDLRFGGEWRATHPGLVAWLDDFSAKVPAFDATKSQK